MKNLHKSFLGAFGTNNFLLVGDEAATYKGSRARSANEAIVVPMPVLERNETSAADAGDWLLARCATLSEQAAEALRAAGLVVAGSETLTGQILVAVCASEAIAMPWLVLVGHATALDSLE